MSLWTDARDLGLRVAQGIAAGFKGRDYGMNRHERRFRAAVERRKGEPNGQRKRRPKR